MMGGGSGGYGDVAGNISFLSKSGIWRHQTVEGGYGQAKQSWSSETGGYLKHGD